MCTLINVIEEPFYVSVDKCYTGILLCVLVNVLEESF